MTSVRKWEKKWDTSGAFAKYAWFPCTLVPTRAFVPVNRIDAAVEASMPDALLTRTRSAMSLAEKRAVAASLDDEAKRRSRAVETTTTTTTTTTN